MSLERSNDDGTFVETYGRSTTVVFVALWLTVAPIINLTRALPLFKEMVLGAVVVAGLTSLEDWGQGAKHALVSGMTAAVLFNLLFIPGSIILTGASAAASGASGESALIGSLGIALGAFSNLLGLVLFSPVGYLLGGAAGSALN